MPQCNSCHCCRSWIQKISGAVALVLDLKQLAIRNQYLDEVDLQLTAQVIEDPAKVVQLHKNNVEGADLGHRKVMGLNALQRMLASAKIR
jgi:hypothetical protein